MIYFDTPLFNLFESLILHSVPIHISFGALNICTALIFLGLREGIHTK